jgi:hypothetical protein
MERDKPTNQHQPAIQVRTETQSNVAAQYRAAQTKGQQQDEMIHGTGGNLRWSDQSIHISDIVIKRTNRPIDPREQLQQPIWILCEIGRENEDQGCHKEEYLK